MRRVWPLFLLVAVGCSAPKPTSTSTAPAPPAKVATLEDEFLDALGMNRMDDAFAMTSATFQKNNNPATIEGRYNAFTARSRRYLNTDPMKAKRTPTPQDLPKTAEELGAQLHEKNPSPPTSWKRLTRIDFKSEEGEAMGAAWLLIVDDDGLERVGAVWFQLEQVR
jgi:hypothetical protein